MHDVAPPAGIAISVRNLHKSFGSLAVLRGVSIDVPKGTCMAVMGGSGTGKSVLIKHVVGLLHPDEGSVWVYDQRVDHLREAELDRLRLRIGFLFQGGALFDSMTVGENLDFILARHTSLGALERADRVEEALEWVDLPTKAANYPASLSGGQKKRIALARSIILKPDILLCDEPTTGLDPVSVRMVSHLLLRLRNELGITIVSITHDLLCAEISADRACFLYEGRVIGEGTLSDLQAATHPRLRNFFGA